jgi:hypothetical protein
VNRHCTLTKERRLIEISCLDRKQLFQLGRLLILPWSWLDADSV